MYIQSITISGFKSYRDATVAGPFSPAHNVVVGRNGSGKSNFFDAVRFLLADSFAHLRGEERVALLHEGAGASVLSAYVEMVFDNSDGRLPFDRSTVALRRMVGLQKDEYLLDRKNVSRTEVFNLLESAGFSRSNPYYIVQQGKVAALCAMSDRNRLDLLKEVAGTRVYDERRDESMRIMDETDAKREKISDVLQYIESRLEELDSEKEELKQFQDLDRDRRALEYTIYVKELDAAKEALEAISNTRASSGSNASERLSSVRGEILSTTNELETAKAELKSTVDDRAGLDQSRQAAIEQVAKTEVDLAEATRTAEAAEETVRGAESELAIVRAAITERRNELRPLDSQFAAARETERTVRSAAAELEASVLALRVKSDRGNKFRSVDERNRYLMNEIKSAESASKMAQAQRSKASADVGRLESSCDANKAKIASHQAVIAQIESEERSAEADLRVLRKQRDAVYAQRHEKWRQDSELEGKVSALSGKLKRLEADKRSTFGAGTYHAIMTVMEAAANDRRQLGPERVFGPLVDLISVDTTFTTAADVTAGNALTHVVVDSDETAACLVRVLQQKRAGRVTFIPLSRLNPNPRPPPAATAEALPLISKIGCEDRFMVAVKQVFGRTMVTQNVDVAAEMSSSHGIDCVTLQGDQVNRHGAMTGGYIDLSRSKIDAARQHLSCQSELACIEPEAAAARMKAGEIDSELSKLLGEIQKLDAAHRSSQSRITQLQGEIEQLSRYVRLDSDNSSKARERILSLDDAIAASEKRRSELELEVSAPLTTGLSAEEESTLHARQAELETAGQHVAEAAADRARLESSVSALKSELEGNLERRDAELQRLISSACSSRPANVADGPSVGKSKLQDSSGGSGQSLEQLQSDAASAKAELSSCEAALTRLDKNCVELEASVSKLALQLESTREEEVKLNKVLEDEKAEGESLFSQRAMHVQKRTDAEWKIRELGSLPADFGKYRSSTVPLLIRKLKRTNEGLKAYAHVNKKALDQFMTFTEQREVLRKRREELETGASAIRQLIESLDQRKDADILRTFKGVSKFFSEVFMELVPGGRASLVMLKASPVVDGFSAGEGKIEYTGVAMKVSFSTTGEAYLLQQLSGGQKSIVALALIFAIQRLDPAPFYLFDEIDANLDATHRQAVANVIRNQAGTKAQFITTTFRPEFVNAGDKWFGVTHRSKVSSVQEVTQDVALTFINKDDVRS